MYKTMLFLHVVGACVWTGGHLVLALRYLPKALIHNSPEIIHGFEQEYEKIGITALITQLITGFWLAHNILPFKAWFHWNNPISQLLMIKIILLVTTFALAIDARLRIIPKLDKTNLKSLALHIIPVTILSVIFVYVGISFKTGGIW